MAPAPEQGYSTPVVWAPDLRALLSGGPQYTAPCGRLEAPRKALPYSKSYGYHNTLPPTNDMTYPSRRTWWHWPPDLRVLFLGGLVYVTPSGATRPLAKACPIPSPAEATSSPNKALAHLSRRSWCHWSPDLREQFLGGLVHVGPLGATRPLAKACLILSPIEATPTAPTKAIAHPSR